MTLLYYTLHFWKDDDGKPQNTDSIKRTVFLSSHLCNGIIFFPLKTISSIWYYQNVPYITAINYHDSAYKGLETYIILLY